MWDLEVLGDVDVALNCNAPVMKVLSGVAGCHLRWWTARAP